MAGQKLTEKTVTTTLKDEAHVVITQKETVSGAEVESVRRIPVNDFVEKTQSELKADLNRIGTTLSNYETVAFTLENKYINNTGAYSTFNGAGITDYIPISKGIDILYQVMSGQAAASVAYYGSTELASLISVETPTVYEMHQGVVSHSVYGANYCRISTFVNDGNSYVKVGYAFNYISNNDRLNALESDALLFDSIQKPFDFSNKRITAFGDSITYGVTSPNLVKGTPYIELFANKVGASNLLNLAVSGSCIADPTNPNSIYSKIKAFTTLSIFIVVSGGTNDFNTSKELGTYGSTDTSTFYGALKDICEYFKTNYNQSTIIFITPIPYTEAYYVSHPRKNALGYDLNDYRRAIFEVATAYGFNVVNGADLGMPTGKGGWDNVMCDDSDGCHPTQMGHELYARALCGKLL